MHEIRGRTFGTPFNVRGVISSFYVVQRIKSYELQCGTKIFAGVYFCGLAIFCVLRELIFAIRTD